MAGRYDRYAADDTYETDGGEATPRPLRARRLVDVMDTPSRGKGRTGSATAEGKASVAQASVLPKAVGKASEAEPAVLPKAVGKEPVARPAVPKKRALKPAEKEAEAALAPDTCAILSVTPSGEGETVTVVMAMPSPTEGRSQRVSFRLLVEQYAELGVKAGEITPDFAEALLEAGRLCGAIRRGMTMLGYGDQSARRLAYKLTAKGVDRAVADAAVAYLTAKGYIHEDSTATLRAEQGVRKGWGARRIREDLCAHGFTREAVEEAMEALSDVDWAEACAVALRKRYGEIPAERGERQKLMAAMMRLGFDTEDIRAAMGGFAETYDDGDFT